MKHLDMLLYIHLNCLIFGLIFFAASVKDVTGAVKTIYTKGGPHTFESTSEGTDCTLNLPSGESCTYTNNNTKPTPDRRCNFPNYSSLFCNFQVDITSYPLSGVYNLTAIGTDGNSTREIFLVYLGSGGIPTETLNVIEGESIYLRLTNSFGGDMNCDAFYPDGVTEVIASGSSMYSPNHWGRKDECGIKVDGVSKRHNGTWKLAASGSKIYAYAEFQVKVTFLEDIDTGPRLPIEWTFGKSGTVSMSQPNSKYCELWNPKKERVQLVTSGCNYTQHVVTDVDDGNWTIVFGMNGKLSEETCIQRIIVTKGDLEVNVTKSERYEGGLDMLCRTFPNPVTDCQFTRPDGKVILPSEGLGNVNYSYFGDGFGNGDCGLTIHQLQEVDKGWWNCSVTVDGTKTSGFINVSATEDATDNPGAGKDSLMFVQKGSDMLLSCKAYQVLEYCWFRHATGFVFPFSTEEVPLSGLLETHPYRYYLYEDTLQLGVCTIHVSTANSSVDSGQWTCHMGVQGSPEEDYKVNITVVVSETDVISVDKEIDLYYNSTPVLKCHSVPKGMPLQYCRFLRPDGKGFNVVPGTSNVVLDKYQYEAEGLVKGECGLKILANMAADEDIGDWTCVARLQGKNQEGQDFITLKRTEVNVEERALSAGAIVGIVLGGAAVLLLIGGLAFYFVRSIK